MVCFNTNVAAPTSGAPVTVNAKNPNQSYSKAMGTLQTYGASANSLSQYASSKYSGNANAASSYVNSVSNSAKSSNTINAFNAEGSATGTSNPTAPNAGVRTVPMNSAMTGLAMTLCVLLAGTFFL